MAFALLTAAIIWNLGTWYFGLPSSSSHTLIGSVIGVGLANQLMQVHTATSGVDWHQASNIGKSQLRRLRHAAPEDQRRPGEAGEDGEAGGGGESG
jgi:hypothetical protein